MLITNANCDFSWLGTVRLGFARIGIPSRGCCRSYGLGLAGDGLFALLDGVVGAAAQLFRPVFGVLPSLLHCLVKDLPRFVARPRREKQGDRGSHSHAYNE